jgi:hypothetical protein
MYKGILEGLENIITSTVIMRNYFVVMKIGGPLYILFNINTSHVKTVSNV